MTKIDLIEDVADEFRSKYPELTMFEALSLGVQTQRNQILENGFVVSKNDKYPSGLEAISIALGFTDNMADLTIAKALENISLKD
ncbi:histidine kinase [Kaistella sp. 97-N-M2]|uniref:histidine kinase n=1 Tax=Kaistella sp. 97-N-M2 TaxID=2908645 RepID=UPI001F3FEC54|nr:histidine kinase [Kaistella sp. 97-N-M2]UJF29893.1 histidine kinase [Kaistella sp. 97-N-M2]